MCGSSQGRSGKVRLWKALSCSSLTGPRGLSPQSLFLGPQLRGQVKQRRQEQAGSLKTTQRPRPCSRGGRTLRGEEEEEGRRKPLLSSHR